MDYPRTYRMPLYAVEQLEEAPEGDPCYLMHYANEVKAYIEALEAERDTLQEALHTVCNGIPGDIELYGGPRSEKVKDALSEYSLRFYRPMFGRHD